MTLSELIISNDFKKTNTIGKFKYCCPFCDGEYKFVVDYNRKNYVCWRCNVRGSLKDEIPTTIDAFTKRVQEFKHGKPGRDFEDFHLPNEALPITRESGVPHRYLLRRGLTEDDIKRYNIKYCSEGFYRDRVIFPFFEEKRLVYYVGRTYLGNEPRYLNAGRGRGKVIFKTFQEPVDVCVLVEGIFTALYVSKVFPAVATLGKIVTQSQARLISGVARRVLIMLDSNAHKEVMDAHRLLNYYMKAKPMFIKKAAPDSYSHQELSKLIKESLHAK